MSLPPNGIALARVHELVDLYLGTGWSLGQVIYEMNLKPSEIESLMVEREIFYHIAKAVRNEDKLALIDARAEYRETGVLSVFWTS